MLKKNLLLSFVLLVMNHHCITFAQYEIEARFVSTPPSLDGEREESSWGLPNSSPLIHYIEYPNDVNTDGTWNWEPNEWGKKSKERSNILVTWEALWDKDYNIYFFITVVDDYLNQDDPDDPDDNKYEDNDSIQLWFESGKLLSWQWYDQPDKDY